MTKVLLKIPLSTYSGYGNDGIGMTQALIRRGADVYLQPTTVQAPLPPEVANLLTKELKAPFDLIVHHVDPKLMKSSPEVQRSSALNIGWTMWESSNLLNVPGHSKFKEQYKNFDALVGYDENSSDCLRPYFKGPIITQQGGYSPKDWEYVERDWHSEDFYFGMIGVLSERKDPFVSIQAFSELKNEDPEFDKHAKLMLKTSAPGLHSKMEDVYPGLRIFYDTWPTELVKRFYASTHVLLAPSRGEGKNMPALEFMSTGGTVIATNWGGHREWLSPEYAYPLDYRMERVDLYKYPKTFNARASVEHMKELMLHTFRNRDEVRQKGKIASQVIPQMCSWDSVIEKLFLKLRDVPGGEELWMKDAMSRRETKS